MANIDLDLEANPGSDIDQKRENERGTGPELAPSPVSERLACELRPHH